MLENKGVPVNLKKKIKVLYVENDPALRGIISKTLRTQDSISEVFDFASGEDAVQFADVKKLDVALIDLSLGYGLMDGLATGLELRRLNEFIGVVIYSQHSFETVKRIIDFDRFEAWSYLPKEATTRIDKIIEILAATAQGQRVVVEDTGSKSPETSPIARLTPRQHSAMSLLASGFDSRTIARKLDVSLESVRKDLSIAYAVLIPEPMPGMDLRMAAIIQHQRQAQSSTINES